MGKRIVVEPIDLTDEQFAALNVKYPPTAARTNKTTGDRAEAIAMIFLEGLYPGCRFLDRGAGPDLALLDPCINVERPMHFEVKGTAGRSVSLYTIVVSSEQSGDPIEQEGVPILRITGVFERNPGIAVLVHGEDFVLENEYRKRARPL